jgi:CBS domain containing-hemolysin-like protein
VLLLATALISLRAPLLPRWWAIVSIVLAAAMLIPPIAWVAVIIFTFWPLITGLLLYLRRGPANDPPAQVDADGAATRT